MMRAAVRKNSRHKKKIAAIEKRYPVYGLANSDIDGVNAAVIGQPGSNTLNGMQSDPAYATLMTFLNDLDEKLDSNG